MHYGCGIIPLLVYTLRHLLCGVDIIPTNGILEPYWYRTNHTLLGRYWTSMPVYSTRLR